MEKKILVIDDDPLVLRTFEKLLLTAKYQVLTASSYEEAMDVIEGSNFDLILSDIRMPRKNGVETVAEIQSKLICAGKQDLPIIFITGYADDSIKLDAKFLGEVMMKPLDIEKLLTTIREYL